MTSNAEPVISANSMQEPELVGLFNRAYADYYVHLEVDAPIWRAMLFRFDVDLEASRVTADGNGIALLAVRDVRGWVGGMGVAPEARRRGAGRRLMTSLLQQAAARAVQRVQLEVLEQNTPAIALYESIGFVKERLLDVWALEAPLSAPGAREITAAEAQAWIAAHRASREPWHREDASVRRFDAPEHPVRGFEVREHGRCVGAALALAVPGRASLLQVAASGDRPAETIRALCTAARGGAPVLRFLNVPTGDVAAEVFREAGARLEARQFEMFVDLSRSA